MYGGKALGGFFLIQVELEDKADRNMKYNNQPISIIIGIEISTSKAY